MRKFRIKVVCLANMSRSPAGEFLLRHYLEREKNNLPRNIKNEIEFIITSGGFMIDGEFMAHATHSYLQQNGIDVPMNWRSSVLNEKDLEQQDLILVMEKYMYHDILSLFEFSDYDKMERKIKTLAEAAGFSGDIKDSIGSSDEEYLQTMEKINKYTEIVAKKIINEEFFPITADINNN
ncbi:MAG: arsenate reductase/protein-tyrosine-phosphatase family protein [Promethearchaeota archaeon]